MNQRHIIFVPGKNPKPPADQHQILLWRSLLEGVRRAESQAASDFSQHVENFKLIAWNYLYYRVYKDISRELPWIDELINQHGPTEEDIREARAWHRRLDRLLYSLVDYLPLLIPLLNAPMQSAIEVTFPHH